jgi:hypothetical protein
MFSVTGKRCRPIELGSTPPARRVTRDRPGGVPLPAWPRSHARAATDSSGRSAAKSTAANAYPRRNGAPPLAARVRSGRMLYTKCIAATHAGSGHTGPASQRRQHGPRSSPTAGSSSRTNRLEPTHFSGRSALTQPPGCASVAGRTFRLLRHNDIADPCAAKQTSTNSAGPHDDDEQVHPQRRVAPSTAPSRGADPRTQLHRHGTHLVGTRR